MWQRLVRERGADVVALVRSPNRAADLANQGVELVEGDVQVALLLVFPSEVIALPNIGEAFPASGLGDAFLESKGLRGSSLIGSE